VKAAHQREGSGSESLFPSRRPALTRQGQRLGTLVIDAEEDFDWTKPAPDTWRSTESIRHVGQLHQILGSYGIVPAYLLTFPVLQDDEAVRILRDLRDREKCVLGIQLHTWVTPPFGERWSREQSFAANIDLALEERKLLSLRGMFIERFGYAPTVFRSGRYGLSHGTAGLLESHGFTIDTSIAPRTSFRAEGGPDFRAFDTEPFWFGRARDLLEFPLSRSVVGWGRRFAPLVYAAVPGNDDDRSVMRSLLNRSRFAERITLSPEGNDARAMRRLVDRSIARGCNLLSLSFHSSSLHVGNNPYVRSHRDLRVFYDRLSSILDYMTGACGFEFVAIDKMPGLIVPPTPVVLEPLIS
jgi:hypothetical protein